MKSYQARFLASASPSGSETLPSSQDGAPLPKLYKGQAASEQLQQITDYSLYQLKQRILEKSLKYPFEDLNLWNPQTIDIKLDLFRSSLLKTYDAFLDKDRLKEIANISMADYFKPRLDRIAAIVYSIHLDRYPGDLAKFYGYTKKLEIITELLTSLLWQHHIETRLVSKRTASPTQLWDLLAPAEWFPKARRMKRKIVMHVGPTNSGKTHNSLKALAKAKLGYYAGPLRLLAREIYERFQEQGISCNLITGEEIVPSLDAFDNLTELSSGTIEMVPLNKTMDICVIDEIQMIADPLRGSAWTNAVLGVQAKELHLCGEPSAVKLIKELVKQTGDELHIREYKRLGKLTVQDEPVRKLQNLRTGDCVIAFSKRKILDLKCEIENTTKLKVGIIYGALPPEIRSKEANNFNSGKYDVLVASDAVGMGLNLSIKRIVFASMSKFDGYEVASLSVSATKQIAGRAGRYSTAEGELEGLVTTLQRRDMALLHKQMGSEVEDLERACIWPPGEFWSYYIAQFKHNILLPEAIGKLAKDVARYRLKDYFYMDFERQVEILNLMIPLDLHMKLTIDDQVKLMLTPVNFQAVGPEVIETCIKFFETILDIEPKTVFDFDFLHLSVLLKRPSVASTPDQILDYLSALEIDHKLVLCFMWLSQRWPTIFVDRESAHEIKFLVEKRISEELVCLRKAAENRGISPDELLGKKMAAKRPYGLRGARSATSPRSEKPRRGGFRKDY